MKISFKTGSAYSVLTCSMVEIGTIDQSIRSRSRCESVDHFKINKCVAIGLRIWVLAESGSAINDDHTEILCVCSKATIFQLRAY